MISSAGSGAPASVYHHQTAWQQQQVLVCIVVSIPTCQAGDPVSILGQGAKHFEANVHSSVLKFHTSIEEGLAGLCGAIG
jgi:hypothetical protein